jgi:hypothetical protein
MGEMPAFYAAKPEEMPLPNDPKVTFLGDTRLFCERP